MEKGLLVPIQAKFSQGHYHYFVETYGGQKFLWQSKARLHTKHNSTGVEGYCSDVFRSARAATDEEISAWQDRFITPAANAQIKQVRLVQDEDDDYGTNS